MVGDVLSFFRFYFSSHGYDKRYPKKQSDDNCTKNAIKRQYHRSLDREPPIRKKTQDHNEIQRKANSKLKQ